MSNTETKATINRRNALKVIEEHFAYELDFKACDVKEYGVATATLTSLVNDGLLDACKGRDGVNHYTYVSPSERKARDEKALKESLRVMWNSKWKEFVEDNWSDGNTDNIKWVNLYEMRYKLLEDHMNDALDLLADLSDDGSHIYDAYKEALEGINAFYAEKVVELNRLADEFETANSGVKINREQWYVESYEEVK